MGFRLRLLGVRAFTLLVIAALLVSPAAAQQTGLIVKDAPLLLLPDASRQPVAIMEAGVVVTVHRREGAWFNITVEGGQFGRRTGYVEARFLEVLRDDPAPPRVTAADAIPPKTAPAQAQPSTPPKTQSAPSPLNREQSQASRTTASRNAVTETFQNSKLNVTVEDKTRELDVILRYEPSALVIVDKRSRESTKTFPYEQMKGAEYSYAKSPRWKTAIFLSPFFLFTSGKKHWFLVQSEGDYALLHLDKTNYRLILAAFEARTALKVVTVADTK